MKKLIVVLALMVSCNAQATSTKECADTAYTFEYIRMVELMCGFKADMATKLNLLYAQKGCPSFLTMADNTAIWRQADNEFMSQYYDRDGKIQEQFCPSYKPQYDAIATQFTAK